MARVQALVRRTAAALKKDQGKVIAQINAGDKQWKDGDLYVAVLQATPQGTTLLAHGYWSWMAGQDIGSTRYLAFRDVFETKVKVQIGRAKGRIVTWMDVEHLSFPTWTPVQIGDGG